MHWKPRKITGVLINGFPFSKIATEREMWWTKSADHFWCDSPTSCEVLILWVIFTPNHLHRKERHFVILTANKPSPLIKIQLENYSFLSDRKCLFFFIFRSKYYISRKSIMFNNTHPERMKDLSHLPLVLKKRTDILPGRTMYLLPVYYISKVCSVLKPLTTYLMHCSQVFSKREYYKISILKN